MSTESTRPRRLPLARAADEFVLTTALLFLAVTVVRWLRDPGSALHIADLNAALAVIGAISGVILTGLILTPSGRRSGGHMNPAVTVTLWLMHTFPGRSVPPYVLAQLAGSAAGTALGRLVWGRAVSAPSVADAAIRPAPTWQPVPVFLAEAGGMLVLIVVVGLLAARPGRARLLPYATGLYVALVIALLGPLSGGSINPARQFGPAALSGQTTDLWIYLVAPMLGAVLGVRLQHPRIRRFTTHRPEAATEGRAGVPHLAGPRPARPAHGEPDQPPVRSRPTPGGESPGLPGPDGPTARLGTTRMADVGRREHQGSRSAAERS